MNTDTLHRLLDANLRLPAEYAEGLTNHLPMALHALWRLGASEARLCQFFDVYAARFEKNAAPAGAAAPLADWLPHRGRYESLPSLQATFLHALRVDDPATVLRRALPHLMPGVGAAAFHGLIRTAHGFEVGHAGELAHALAYWAARWMPRAEPTAAPAMADEPWAAALASPAAAFGSSAPLISLRMQEAQHSPPYHALAGRLKQGASTLPRLAAFAATAYADSGDFTALHLVTGCRAARVLLPLIDDPVPALAALVRAFVAAYLSSGRHPAAATLPAPLPHWSDITAWAIDSDDDHVIKLVDACIEEALAYGSSGHLRTAARALR